MTDTDWPQPGDRVAIYWWGGHEDVTLATVNRLTPTQIVLDNERRFTRKDRTEVGSGPRITSELVRHDDSRVTRILTERQIRRLRQQLDELLGKGKIITPNDAAELLDQAADLIASCREKITRLQEN